MGNFVHVYADHLDSIQKMIGSKDAAARERVVAANERRLNLNPGSKDEVLRALDQLFASDYPTEDEHPDASNLIHAFHLICSAVAEASAETEIYVDEEQSPEIWNFVWSGHSTPFHLPLSEWGSPAVSHWRAEDIEDKLETFGKLDFEALAVRAGTDYRAEITDICNCLSFARAKGMGIFVFFFE